MGSMWVQLEGTMHVNRDKFVLLPIFGLEPPSCSRELHLFQDLVSETCIYFFTWSLTLEYPPSLNVQSLTI